MNNDQCGRRPVERHVREAARWLVRLQHPNLSPQLLLRWKKWQGSAQNREAFDSLESLWRAIHRSADDISSAFLPRKALPSRHVLLDEWTAPESRIATARATRPKFTGHGAQLATCEAYEDLEIPDQSRQRSRLVSEEAAYWYIRCTDEPAMRLSDRQRFFAWLRRSPENIAELLRVSAIEVKLAKCKVFAKAESDESSVLGSNVPLSTSQQHKRPTTIVSLDQRCDERMTKRAVFPWRFGTLAAGIALTILLANAAWYAHIDDTISTAAGQWQHITLPDGSVTHVGGRTRLKVDFNDQRRSVHLYRGEAVFEVSKDPARPFTVITPLVDMTAVGTRFGVSIDAGVTATVSEGAVTVMAIDNPDNEKEVTLRAGDQLRVSDGGLAMSEFARVDAARALEWANGWLVFHGETIEEAATAFNIRNVVQIEIEQPEIAARALRGHYRFRVDSPATFARAIAAENGLALIEDRSGEVMRLRLEMRRGGTIGGFDQAAESPPPH